MPAPGRRVIVKLAAGPAEGAAARFDELRRRIPGNAKLVRPPSRSGRAVFEIDPSLDPVEVSRNLAAAPGVEYAEPDTIDRST